MASYGEYENNTLRDPASSEGRSGVETPREHFLPSEPAYDKVDPHETRDYHKTYYSPYAQLQLYHPVQIGTIYLKEGYYLVQLHMGAPIPDGSQDKATTSIATHSRPSRLEAAAVSQPPAAKPSAYEKVPDSLWIKQMGQVAVKLPIGSVETPPKRIKKGPIAQLIVEPGNPTHPHVVYVTYCHQNRCYRSMPLEPGLVQ